LSQTVAKGLTARTLDDEGIRTPLTRDGLVADVVDESVDMNQERRRRA
jgi:hypothetical protein